MKKLVTILLVLTASLQVNAQTLPEAKKQIKSYLDGISYWRFQYVAEDTSFAQKVSSIDSVAFYNEILRKYLINTSMSLPAMLTQDIEPEGSDDLVVVTSDDKTVRIISWETHIDNKPGNCASVLIYRQGSTKNATTLVFPSPGKNAMGAIDVILSMQNADGRKYYLPVFKTKQADNKVSKCITAFDLSVSDKQAFIFPEDCSSPGVIQYSYDYMSNYDFKKMREVYKVSVKGKKLYVPHVEDDMKLKGKMDVYVFDGSKFVYEQTEK